MGPTWAGECSANRCLISLLATGLVALLFHRDRERPQRLVNRRLAEFVAPFQRVEIPDEDMVRTNVDARFSTSGVSGYLRLLAGMVLANRPWQLFPSFKTAIAAAFGMAAWVLASSSIWILQVGDGTISREISTARERRMTISTSTRPNVYAMPISTMRPRSEATKGT